MVSAVPSQAVAAARRVAAATIVKASAIWSGLWLVGLSFAVVSVPASFRSLPLAVSCLAAAWLVWALSLAARAAPAPTFAATAVLTALIVQLDTQPSAVGDPYSAMVLWLNLAALACGFLLVAHLARWAIGSLCALSLLIGLVMTSGVAAVGGDSLWRALVAIQAYSLVIGMATTGGVQAIRHAAAQADDATSIRADAEGAEAREAAMRGESFRIARALHDGPLNTLAALRIGSIDPDSIRERCAVDQLSIDHLLGHEAVARPDHQTALSRVVAVASERARLLGLRLRVDAAQGPERQPPDGAVDPAGDAAVPAAVESAICGAVAEALLNVAKHSGSRGVDLSVVSESSGMTVLIADHGVGFDRSERFAPLSIVKRCEQVGVRAAVTSRPQRGTTVALSWERPTAASTPARFSPDFGDAVLVPLARQVAAWFVALFVVLSLLDIGHGFTATTAIALVIITTVALSAAYRRQPTPLPIWLRWVLALTAGVLAWLPGASWNGAAQLGLWWWGAEAGMVLVLLMVFLVGRAGWVWLAYLCFMAGMGVVAFGAVRGGMAQDGLAISLTVALIDSGVIYGAWRLRQLITWFTATATRGQDDAISARTRLAAAAERDRVRRIWARSVLSSTRDFMAALAAGDRDATDPAVLAECARVEALLRAVVSIDAAWGELAQALIALVGWANQRMIRVQVRVVSAVSLPTAEQAVAIEATLHAQLSRARRDSTVVFTVGSVASIGGCLIAVLEADSGSVLAESDAADSLAAAARQRLDAAGIVIRSAIEGDQMMIELTWAGNTAR